MKLIFEDHRRTSGGFQVIDIGDGLSHEDVSLYVMFDAEFTRFCEDAFEANKSGLKLHFDEAADLVLDKEAICFMITREMGNCG